MLDKKQQKNLEWNCNLENQKHGFCGYGIKNEQIRNIKFNIGIRKHLDVLSCNILYQGKTDVGAKITILLLQTLRLLNNSQTEFSSKNVKTKTTKTWSVQTHAHGSEIWPVRRHRNRPRASERNFYNKEQVTFPSQKNWRLLYELKVYSLEKDFIYK